jgi:hypothetical protein
VPDARPTEAQSSSVVQHRSGFFFVQLASSASATIVDVFIHQPPAKILPERPSEPQS